MKFFRVLLVPMVTTIVILAMAAAFSGLGATAAAQRGVADSGDAAPPSAATLPSNGDGRSPEESSSGPRLPDDGPDSPNQAEISFSYYQIIGSAFQPRESSITYAYSAHGCIYKTGGADTIFQAPVLLPRGSEIKYVRAYYIDSGVGSSTVYLSRYEPGEANQSLTTVASSGTAGFQTQLSALISETVDYADYAYVLNWEPGAATNDLQLCGVRIAYYAPGVFGAYIPFVGRE